MKYQTRFIIDTLIRNNLPKIMESQGIAIFSRNVEKEEYISKLKDKLIEEVNEVIRIKPKSKLVENLVNILEIIYALASAKDIDAQKIENLRIEKNNFEGNFDKHIYCKYISMNSDNPNVSHYRLNYSKYYEINEDFEHIIVNEKLRQLIESESDEKDDQVLWNVYYKFEEIVCNGTDIEIVKIIDLLNNYDFLKLPVIFDLVAYKKLEILEILYKRGVPFNYTEWDGSDALHVACGASGNLETTQFLIENNLLTDIHKENVKGDTAYTLAVSYNHTDIIDYLEEKFYINYIKLSHLKTIIETKKRLK